MTAAFAPAITQALQSEAPAPPPINAGAIAASAVDCLLLELETWPKPGLVSHIDSGSHTDMDAGMFRTSAGVIAPYFRDLGDAGARGCGMERLRVIGMDAEAAMLAATSGVNTHRGAIFGLGLLCAAAGARASGRANPSLSLGTIVSRLWGRSIIRGPVALHSHGGQVRGRYGAGGARMEAAQGFPTVYQVGLPALRHAAHNASDDDEAARVQACFALIAALEDTNLLHRGGLPALRFAQRTAQDFLDQGGIGRPGWRDVARLMHESFVARWLSPGGSADLLAMTLFVDANEGRP